MFFKAKDENADERSELMEALAVTRTALEGARMCFEFASEPELVDATVYEINSLQARYNYLLRRAREAGCRADMSFRAVRALR